MKSIDKKLSPKTIIPEEMYIERSADKQLVRNIQDMGRPAYILVARQMGKTNLLINTKRKLESENDIYGYIDLSNRFDTDRECFRNIIDKIIEVNFSKLGNIEDEIYRQREGASIAAHREHIRELRKILSKISGKLIINLDEIDSLTAANYSDKIFAQIRSVYFERINYPEFERLSYILSGVAEPNEIIKDKSISPFNIGQKILLGDFSPQEFSTLLCKANLESVLSEEVVNRVFYWTNGNPRLSWEVLSELENLTIENTHVNTATVDDVVNNLYLNNFDRPPVDHIRSLVQSSPELQDSIISIYYGNQENISNEIRSKLYLSGILSSDYEFGDVRIKNRIVENSLDLNWLNKLKDREKGKFSIAQGDKNYESKEYSVAANIYKNIIASSALSKEETLKINYKLGACYFYLGESEKIIKCFEESMFDKTGYLDFYLEQLYMLAFSYKSLNDFDRSLQIFDEIIDYKESDFYHLSLMEKTSILAIQDIDLNRKAIIKSNEFIIKDIESKGLKQPEALSGSYFSLAELYKKDDPSKSYNYYLESSESANIDHKIKPLIHAVSINTKAFSECFTKILKYLSSDEVILDSEANAQGLDLSAKDIGDFIVICNTFGGAESVDEIIDAIKNHCLEDQSNLSVLLLEVGIKIYLLNQVNEAKQIFNRIVSLDHKNVSSIPNFIANKYLSFLDQNNSEAFEKYFKGIQNYTDNLDTIDLLIFQHKIVNLIETDETDLAEKYCDFLIKIVGLNSRQSRVLLVSILYFKIKCTVDLVDRKEQLLRLKDIVLEVEDADLKGSALTINTFRQIVRDVDNLLLMPSKISTFIRNEPKLGRNDLVTVKYSDGRVETKKYKLVMESLKNEMCVICK